MSRRKDPVTPEVLQLVLRRDVVQMMLADALEEKRAVCVAPAIDPAELERCWGRTTLDHIKAEPRMGVRAKSDALHLVSLCQGHSEDGMKAGYQWNTSHRPELREYIARTTWRCPVCDGVGILSNCGFCGSERPSLGPSRAATEGSAG